MTALDKLDSVLQRFWLARLANLQTGWPMSATLHARAATFVGHLVLIGLAAIALTEGRLDGLAAAALFATGLVYSWMAISHRTTKRQPSHNEVKTLVAARFAYMVMAGVLLLGSIIAADPATLAAGIGFAMSGSALYFLSAPELAPRPEAA